MTETDCLEDTTPSAKLVYKVLEYADEPLTQPELAEETRLPKRTVRHGLEQLLEIDAVNERTRLKDARQRQYWTDK